MLSMVVLVFNTSILTVEDVNTGMYGVDVVHNDDVTLTVMSCNRFKLLNKTLRSISDTIPKFRDRVIMIDCYNKTFHRLVLDTFPDFKILIGRSLSDIGELRLMSNFDHLFEYVHTPYWFHMEDDWVFYRNASDFIDKAQQVLKKDEKVFQVIATSKRHCSVRTNRSYHAMGNYKVLRTLAGPGGVFGSFSANPFVMRSRDKQRYIGMFEDHTSEAMVSRHVGKRHPEAHIGIFDSGYAKHIGSGNSKSHIKPKK